MARLDRATHLHLSPRHRQVEIIPVGIVLFDQGDLPGPLPFLDSLLTLNGFCHVLVILDMHQAGDIVALRLNLIET